MTVRRNKAAAAGKAEPQPKRVERVQTGLRIEKRLLKTLKALAEVLDLSLGDLVEGIVLHALEGKSALGVETLAKVEKLREIYGLTLTASDSHKLKEKGD